MALSMRSEACGLMEVVRVSFDELKKRDTPVLDKVRKRRGVDESGEGGREDDLRTGVGREEGLGVNGSGKAWGLDIGWEISIGSGFSSRVVSSDQPLFFKGEEVRDTLVPNAQERRREDFSFMMDVDGR